MKKTIYSVIVIVSAFVLAVSCTKEVGNLKEEKEQAIDPAPVDPTPVDPFSITVTIPQDMTKISFEQENKGQDGDKVKLTWDDTDELVIMDNGNPTDSRVLIIPPSGISGDGKTATFVMKSGQPDMFTPSNGKYDLLYGAASLEDALTKDYASQTQTGNASLDALKDNYIALISGVNTIENIEFDKTWAEANGGTFKETGIIRLWLQMPTADTEVASVIINAPSPVFYKSNATTEKVSSLKLSFTGNPTPDTGDHNTITGYFMMPWKNVTFASLTQLSIVVKTSAGSFYSRTFNVAAGKSFDTGKVNSIKLSNTGLNLVEGSFAGGTGVEDDPWLIATKAHMQNISANLSTTDKKYFKMIDDVDMEQSAWTPLNTTSPYNKAIDFDGNGRTIFNFTSSGKYASFAGVLNGAVYNVTFYNASITSTQAKAGVVAGFLGTTAVTPNVQADCHDVTVKNSTLTNTSATHLGGIAGIAQALSASLSNCHVINTTITGQNGTDASTSDARAAGLVGELAAGYTCINCSAEGVTVSGSKNVGGLIGVAYGRVEECSSSGSVSSTNTVSNKDIQIGGLVGFFETGTITKCHSSVTINQTTNGRSIGGLVGMMKAGTLEKSYAFGNVTGLQRNVGGLVGCVTNTSGTSDILNCYSAGNVKANSYVGGFIGLHEKGSVNVSNCYSASKVEATQFAAGGLVGVCSTAFTMTNSAAWNSEVTPAVYAANNWSSGSVIGVTFPSCTLTNNYRKPGDWLTAYWKPGTYDHADVSSSNKLVIRVGTEAPYTYRETTAVSTANGQDGYPIFPYHGHYTAETSLSTLASTTLGWSDTVWDFSDPLPTLR